MSGTRFTAGLLAVVVATVIVGCGALRTDSRADASSPSTQAGAVSAHPSETLTPLFSEVLPNAPGESFTSAVVDFPPSAHAVPHRHGNAFVYAYVLEGAVRSQLEGQPAHDYQRGESWSEPPGAHHVATENISGEDTAKLLVVFIAPSGQQLKIEDHDG